MLRSTRKPETIPKAKTASATMSNLEHGANVAVIGAGVGGMLSAVRLLQARPDLQVTVLESTNRVGGRLLSVHGPLGEATDRDDGTLFELGGMRYFPSVDTKVAALVEELGLDGVLETYIADTNMAYVKGVRTTIGNAPRFIGPRYLLYPDEKGKSPQEIVNKGILRCLPPRVARESAHPDHMFPAIYASGFLSAADYWQMLAVRGGVSPGAHAFYTAMGGYNMTSPSPSSAHAATGQVSCRAHADALARQGPDMSLSAACGIREEFSLAGDKADDQHFVVGGYASLAQALADKFVELGGRLVFNTKARSVERRSDGTWKVGYESASGTVGKALHADSVILALPPPALASLSLYPTLPPESQRVLFRASEPWQATKIFVKFGSAWWTNRGRDRNLFGGALNLSGRTVTDTMARQVYYYSEDENTLLIYCDQADAAAWRCVMPADDVYVETDNGDGTTKIEWVDASDPAVAELKAKLVEVLGVAYGVQVPEPQAFLAKHWAYGTQFWRPDTDLRANQQTALMPYGPLESLRVVGDSYSSAQGWVEGACSTVDACMTSLGIPLPLATATTTTATRAKAKVASLYA
ncbi:PRK07208 superfamily incomplete domain protein [Mollivirus kamchatka]|nr:PRK07208 superfamily incomplete domain protein [Mollivirus kamchatka]